MQRRRADEGVDTAALGELDGFARPIDVAEVGASQTANDRVPGELGNLRHGFEVAFRGDREPCFDDVDAHVVEKLGDLQFLLERHRRAGALFAVAQRRVEDDDLVFVALRHCRRVIGRGCHGSYPLPGDPCTGLPLIALRSIQTPSNPPGHDPGRRPEFMRPRGR